MSSAVSNVITRVSNNGWVVPFLLSKPLVLKIAAALLLFSLLKRIRRVMTRKSLANQIILITGGASGLGRRMALGFGALGAKIVLWDINQSGLDKVATELRQAGVKDVWTFQCDLSSREQIYDVAEKTKKATGHVDVLVNNAGIVHGKSILADDWNDKMAELTMAINTNAHFWTCRAFLRDMVKRNNGHLVTIASAAGLQGTVNLSDYCASKFGAYGFNEAVRRELKKNGATGVKTTVVCPFYINTGMFEGVKSRFPLLPILDEGYAANQIINAVRENREILIMPSIIGNSRFLNALLPSEWGDSILTLLGVSSSMDHFIGRKKN